MARVIVDAGPLIAFARVNQTGLLQQLFGRVCITASVQRECLAKPCTDSEALYEVMQEDWLHVCEPIVCEQPLSRSLGNGERDSIHLALEDPSGSLLIMDDILARKQTIRLGLSVAGSVRILDIAEHRNLISSAAIVISDMRDHGYRISTTILDQIRSKQGWIRWEDRKIKGTLPFDLNFARIRMIHGTNERGKLHRGRDKQHGKHERRNRDQGKGKIRGVQHRSGKDKRVRWIGTGDPSLWGGYLCFASLRTRSAIQVKGRAKTVLLNNYAGVFLRPTTWMPDQVWHDEDSRHCGRDPQSR